MSAICPFCRNVIIHNTIARYVSHITLCLGEAIPMSPPGAKGEQA